MACTIQGCKTVLACVDTDGTERLFGQIESWTLNDSVEDSTGTYIAGTLAEPQPTDNFTAYLEFPAGSGVYYEKCVSSSNCTQELSINGRYCFPESCTGADRIAQQCLICNAPIEIKGYICREDNSLELIFQGTGTVGGKNRSFTGGTETATFDATVTFDGASDFQTFGCFH